MKLQLILLICGRIQSKFLLHSKVQICAGGRNLVARSHVQANVCALFLSFLILPILVVQSDVDRHEMRVHGNHSQYPFIDEKILNRFMNFYVIG